MNTDMDEVVHMVLRGDLAELMVKFAPQIYHKPVTCGNKGETMLYVALQKALYGCLWLALLFYLDFAADLEGIGFCLNLYDPCDLYDPCVTNNKINGAQLRMTFHVDDIKVSHLNSREVDSLRRCCFTLVFNLNNRDHLNYFVILIFIILA